MPLCVFFLLVLQKSGDVVFFKIRGLGSFLSSYSSTPTPDLICKPSAYIFIFCFSRVFFCKRGNRNSFVSDLGKLIFSNFYSDFLDPWFGEATIIELLRVGPVVSGYRVEFRGWLLGSSSRRPVPSPLIFKEAAGKASINESLSSLLLLVMPILLLYEISRLPLSPLYFGLGLFTVPNWQSNSAT